LKIGFTKVLLIAKYYKPGPITAKRNPLINEGRSYIDQHRSFKVDFIKGALIFWKALLSISRAGLL
jgi:hypothetical protein